MDKKKERTLQEVRKEIGLQMQDRRSFLNTLLNIKNLEMSIGLKKDHLTDLKSQLNSIITERDKNGIVLTKEQVKRDIVVFEFQLKQTELNLDYVKEDLYYILHVNEGVMQKVKDFEDLKNKLNAHFALVREEYEKVKEAMKDAV